MKQRLRYLFGAGCALVLVIFFLNALIQASPLHLQNETDRSLQQDAVKAYIFPNPSTPQETPALRIETNLDAQMEAHIFDVAGNRVLNARIQPHHRVNDNGDLVSAYEWPINPNQLTSGVYHGYVMGWNGNQNLFREKFSFTLVK